MGWAMRLFVGVCLAMVVSLCAVAQTPEAPELLNKSLFDIGGRRINLVCIGHGPPVAVFLYGGDANLLDWQPVQEPASRITKTCFYDPAGFGYSDPSPRPMTADNVVDDLHAALGRAKLRGRYVLVGHSAGGLYATLYADRYLSDVAGLVLIDPQFAGSAEREIGMTAAERSYFKAAVKRGSAHLLFCADLAARGKISIADPHGCFQFAAGRTPEEIAYLADQYTKPFRYESLRSEGANYEAFETGTSEDSREEARAAHSFGDIPMIVLTRSLVDPDPGYTAAEEQASYQFWKKGHDALARRSTRGESIVVPNTSHTIQLDQPQAVIDAIRNVVSQVRASPAH